MKKVFTVTIGVLVVAALALAIIPTTRDEIHWRWASHKDETASYESYVKTWPEGRHAGEAQMRYDEHGWAEAKAANTVQGFEQYVQLHAEGKHVTEAKGKATALRTDQVPYDAALRRGTEASLKTFLVDFPGHVKQAEAQQALKDITEGRDIVDLIREKKIEVKTQGSGIQSVAVSVRRRVPYPLTVRIPVGTYFVSANQSSQNMVTTEESRIHLAAVDWEDVSPEAACANRPRDIPSSDDRFTVQRSPHQAELAKLIPILEKAGVSYAVRQAAVWIVTDNADYDDLGILVTRSQFQIFGGTRQINQYESARALKILDEAGINIKQKTIWRDRQTIISGLEDGDLKTWLKDKK